MKLLPPPRRPRFAVPVSARPAAPAIFNGPLYRRPKFMLPAIAMLAGGTIFMAQSSVQAATDTFTGGNNGSTGTNNLSLSTNYTPNATPASGDTLVFGNTVAGTNTITDDLAAGFTLGALTFSSGTLADTISGNAFTLGGNVTNSSTNLQTVDDALSLTATRTITLTTGGGNFTVGTLGGTDGVISSTGASGLTMAGTGVLTLNGLNTYTGTTTVNATGTLNIDSTSAIGTGQLTIAGGGTINNASGAAETLTTNNTFSLNSFTFTGTNNLTFGTGTATLATGTTATITANTLTFGGTFALGTNTLTKAGAGTLVLNGAVTGTGGITITAGTVTLAGASSYSGNTQVGPGTFLNANGTNSSAGTTTAGGTGGGTSTINLGTGTNGGLASGAISAAGSGPTIVFNTPASAVTLTNAINQSGGGLTFGGTSALTLSGNVAFNTGGAGGQSFTANVPVTVNGTLALNTAGAASSPTFAGGSNITLNGVVSSGNATAAGFTDTNTATLTLAAANTFSATANLTAATAGTLDLANGLALQNATLNQTNGTLVFDSVAATPTAFSIGGLSGTKAVALANSAGTAITLTLGGVSTTATFTGNLTGSGSSLVKVGTGTQTLSGTGNTYTGGTTVNGNGGNLTFGSIAALPATGAFSVNAGTLQINNGGTSYTSPSITINAASGKTANFSQFNSGSSATVVVSGPAISVVGTGGGTNQFSVAGSGGYNNLTQSITLGASAAAPANLSIINLDGAANNVATLTVTGFGNLAFSNTASNTKPIQFNGSYNNVGTISYSSTQTAGTASSLNGLGANVTGLTLAPGTETFQLTTANAAFTGDTAITSGTVTLTNGNALQNSVLNQNGGVVSFGTLTAAAFGGLNGSTNLALANTTPAAVALTVGNSNVANSASTNTLAPVYSGVLSGAGSIIKVGTDTQTFSGANTYTGSTTIDQGTLAVAADQTLTGALIFGAAAASTNTGSLDLSTTPSNATFGGLNVQTNSATANTITVGASKTLTLTGSATANVLTVGGIPTAGAKTSLTVTGATGTLAVSDPTRNIVVAEQGEATAADSATLDLSGLGTFTANVANVYVGRPTTATGTAATGKPNDTLTLAGSNTITASGVIALGGTSGSTGSGTIKLGTANTLNAGSFVVGVARDNGTILFNTGLTNPSVTIRGASGGTSRTNIYLGDQTNSLMVANGSGGSQSSTGTVNFTGGSVDAMVDNLFVGYGGGVTGGNRASGVGVFTVDGAASNVNINTLVIGQDVNDTQAPTGGSTTSSTGTFTLTNGNVVVNTALTIANDIDTTANTNAQNVVGSFLQTGGTATIGSANTPVNLILGNHVSGGNAGLDTATVNLTGGTLTVNGDISQGNVGAGTIASTLTLNGGTLDLTGHNLGTAAAPIGTLNFQSGTLQNVAEINNGATLTKTTSGTLTLAGTNSYTGGTAINGGVLRVSVANALGTTGTISFGGGTLQYANAASVMDYSSRFSAAANQAYKVDVNGQAVTYATGLTGTGTSSLTVSSTATGGSLTLTNASTYAGATIINTGATLNLGDGTTDGSIASTSGVTNNGALVYNLAQADRAPAYAISGTGSVALNGTHTLTLTAANTYTGATTVNAGTLLVNGSIGSTAAAGAVTVNNNGTLGGSGMLTVASAAVNGTLAPGATVGATTGALTLNTTSGLTISGTLLVGVSPNSGGGNTVLNTNGLLALGTNSTLALSNNLDGASNYDIANYGSLTGAFTNFTVPNGYTINYDGSTFATNDIELDFSGTAVPEPSTWLFGALATATVGLQLRRRKGRSN